MRAAYGMIGLMVLLALNGCATVNEKCEVDSAWVPNGVLLPNANTGKCYCHSKAGGGLLASSVDGWRCAGLKVGDTARTGDRP